MKISQLKRDRHLRPYFLRYLKANLLVSKVVFLAFIPGADKQKGLEQILEFEQALEALVIQLQNRGMEKEGMSRTIEEVCEILLEEIGAKRILESSPELLIVKEHCKN